MGSDLPVAKCALCGREIQKAKDLFQASGSFFPGGDPLAPLCNAPLHWSCYAQWPQRARFARQHVDAWVKANRRNPFWWNAYCDEQVYISLNPSRGFEQASVRLYAVGSDIRVPLPRWKEWLARPERVTPDLQDVEREALQAVLPGLRRRFPDDHALVHAIDPDEKQPRRSKQPARSGTTD